MLSHETAKLLCYGYSTIQVFGKGLRQSQLKQSMKKRLENNKIQPVKEYVGISLWLVSNRLFEKTCRCWKQLISMEIFHHSQILTFTYTLFYASVCQLHTCTTINSSTVYSHKLNDWWYTWLHENLVNLLSASHKSALKSCYTIFCI